MTRPGRGAEGAAEPARRGAAVLLAVFLAFALGFALGARAPPPAAGVGAGADVGVGAGAGAGPGAGVGVGAGAGAEAAEAAAADGFWDERVERALPPGFGDEDDRSWVELVRTATVARLEPGCGRMQNRLVTFGDGTEACARYRQNGDQIQGEVLSYHLGRLLRLRNLPPSAVATVNASAGRWAAVRGALADARWRDGRPVVLTRFIRDLEPAPIPAVLRRYTRETLADDSAEALALARRPPAAGPEDDGGTGGAPSLREAVEMAQWSDLIVFDYLTANLDRVVNNLYNLRWNPRMMSSPAHNLARTASSRALVFLDNESGLLHGYRLLDRYEPYHRLLLGALCAFGVRRPTVLALAALARAPGGAAATLARRSAAAAAAVEASPPLPDANAATLDRRVRAVLRRAAACAHSPPAPTTEPSSTPVTVGIRLRIVDEPQG